MDIKDFLKINPKLILIKLHFFFWYGGLGGSLPYLVLLGKSLNITGTAIGICFTAKTCLILLTIPLVGALVDYYQNIKYYAIAFLIGTSITGLSILFIPPINIDYLREASKQKPETANWTTPLPYNYTSCEENNCTFASKTRNITGLFLTNSIDRELHRKRGDVVSQFLVSSNSSVINETSFITHVYEEDTNHTKNIFIQFRNVSSNCDQDQSSQESEFSVYNSYQFWVYLVLVVLGGIFCSNADSLSEVACYELLGPQRHLYGSQRLFGTIGWALVCALSGFLNDISSANKCTKDYSPGFYLMGTLLAIDVLIALKMPMPKSKASKNMSGDVMKVIRSCDVATFAIGAMFIGILTTIVNNYEFWLLQEMGASQTLMGATIAIQCSFEVPFFVISVWIVKKLGCFNCLVLCFFAFTIRCGLYYLIHNPWWALLIDTSHGLTFALFHFCVMSFASLSAPAGTEATVLGILSKATSQLGAITANLLAGPALDKVGSRLLFGYSGVFGGVCTLTFIILPRILKIKEITDLKKPNECMSDKVESQTIL